jgi:hypothetical protein
MCWTVWGFNVIDIDFSWVGQCRNLIQVVMRFPMMSRPALRHTQPPVQWIMGLFGW